MPKDLKFGVERSPLQPLCLMQHTSEHVLQQNSTQETTPPAKHAMPAVLGSASQPTDVHSPCNVDICCNALYGDATTADSPDSGGHCHTPMSRLNAHVTKENIKPLPHGSRSEQHVNQRFGQSFKTPSKDQTNQPVAQHQHLSHPLAEMLSQQPSQPAADVCLFGSPPRNRYEYVIHTSPSHAADTDGSGLQNCLTSSFDGKENVAHDGYAERDFVQILQAAQHQRVSCLLLCVNLHLHCCLLYSKLAVYNSAAC